MKKPVAIVLTVPLLVSTVFAQIPENQQTEQRQQLGATETTHQETDFIQQESQSLSAVLKDLITISEKEPAIAKGTLEAAIQTNHEMTKMLEEQKAELIRAEQVQSDLKKENKTYNVAVNVRFIGAITTIAMTGVSGLVGGPLTGWARGYRPGVKEYLADMLNIRTQKGEKFEAKEYARNRAGWENFNEANLKARYEEHLKNGGARNLAHENAIEQLSKAKAAFMANKTMYDSAYERAVVGLLRNSGRIALGSAAITITAELVRRGAYTETMILNEKQITEMKETIVLAEKALKAHTDLLSLVLARFQLAH